MGCVISETRFKSETKLFIKENTVSENVPIKIEEKLISSLELNLNEHVDNKINGSKNLIRKERCAVTQKGSTFSRLAGKNNSVLKMNFKHESSYKGIVHSTADPNLTLESLIEKSKTLKFQVLPSPIQSENDKKEYKVIKLENGLTACLISDKAPLPAETSENESDSEESSGDESDMSTDSSDESNSSIKDIGSSKDVEEKMAAAGLCIGVGTFSDPKEVQGLAHFLEHMVFMGSEKFPEENDFDAFIKKGGGSDNASTDAESTCFYFECLEKHLYGALDKFAQFFISPLMKKSAMTREREAIDSEFQMALPSDDMRKEQLLCNLANPESPVNSFGWGNLITLKDDISDDKLYEKVHEFRKRHYSAHRMTLAIQARLPMEIIQSFVLDCFHNVPTNNLPPDDFKKFVDNVFNTPEFKKIFYIKPVNDVCQLDLIWSLPPLQGKYKTKPHHYISQLLGDEGKGSLLAYLRKKVWGLSTSIGTGDSGMEENSLYTIFTVSVVLTKDGFTHLYDVIEVVHSYMNMLKKIGPQRRFFDEMKMISDTAFKFSREESPVDIVEDLCDSMQIYPPEDYIVGSELFYEYDPKGIEEILNLLTVDKMSIRVLTNNLPNGLKFDKEEKWFGTHYTYRDIPKDWLEKWLSVDPYPELTIPPPNPYLTTDFSILPDIPNIPDYPRRIIKTNLLEMWYRKDQKFKLPLAYYNFYLISPLAVESPKNGAMLDLVMNLIVVAITEKLYPASYADLSYSFGVNDKGLVIKVSGYNEKLSLVIDVISKYLNTFNDHLSEAMFDAVKEKIIRNYHNRFLKPSTLSKDVRLNLLVMNSWTPFDKYQAIVDVQFQDIQKFFKDFMKTLYIKSLVQGNVSEENASEIIKKFAYDLRYEELPQNSYPLFRVVQIPAGETCCRVQSFNKNDSNSIITNYYQSGPFSIKNNVIIEIIMLLIEEPLFDELRTKEQLGYSVYCSIRDTYGILGYTITVNAQANKFTTSHVDERIENFLKVTQKILSETTEDDLEESKIDLIKTKQVADVHLREEVNRNWSEITSDEYVFDRLKKEIEIVENIKLDEIRDWWIKHNSFGNRENYRKLSIQIVGNPQKMASSKTDLEETTSHDKLALNMLGSEDDVKKESRSEQYFVRDVNKFKENLILYPPSQVII